MPASSPEPFDLDEALKRLIDARIFDLTRHGQGVVARPGDREELRSASDAIRSEFSRLRSALEEATKDAERWRKVRPGFFITPHPIDDPDTGEVEVVYQSGWLDEYANALYHGGSLARDDRDISSEITAVVDAADSRPRRSRSPQQETAE